MKRMRHQNMFQSQGFLNALASVAAIVIGLLLGFLLLLAFDSGNAVSGMQKMLTAGVGSLDKLAKVFYQAAPLILTGLSVGFAFKTGLFNIGASGQFVIGAFCAIVAGVVFKLPWWGGLLAGMVGGAVWGLFPGLFKALFNVNEVITSIMFNWIGLFLVNLCFANIPQALATFYGATNPDRTAELSAANVSAIIPRLGLDTLMGSKYMNISIFISMLFALVMYVVLNRTTFGYELKACGHNRNASIYAGINAKRNIVLSMVFAGALAGVAGGIYYLSGTTQYTLLKVLPTMGFNGIPVALLATSNPIGTIFSALFISYIQVGGEAMQPEFAKETIDIIIAVIIYLAAFSLMMRTAIGKLMNRRKRQETLDAEDELPAAATAAPHDQNQVAQNKEADGQ